MRRQDQKKNKFRLGVIFYDYGTIRLNQLLVASLIFLSATSVASVATATPSVSAVSKASNSLSITGASFGTGPNVIIFDQFNEGNAGSAIPTTSPTVGSDWTSYASQPVYSAVAHSGKTSMLTQNNGSTLQFTKTFTPATEAFVSFWVRIPQGTNFPNTSSAQSFSSGGHWKMMWLMDGATGYNKDNNMILGNFIGGNNWTLFTNNDGFNMYQEPFKSGANNWWTWTGWMRHSYWVKGGANPTSDPGSVLTEVITEGVRKAVYSGNLTSQRSVSPYDQVPSPMFAAGIGNNIPQWDRINVPGFIAGSDTNVHPVYDDVYISTGANAQARVEMCNSPTWADRTHCEIQPATAWTKGQITANYNSGSFTNGQTAYVYVVDSDGIVNSNGYMFTIQSESTSSSIPAPTNLTRIN